MALAELAAQGSLTTIVSVLREHRIQHKGSRLRSSPPPRAARVGKRRRRLHPARLSNKHAGMSAPVDSSPKHWSFRLPPRWRAMALLSRFDRPIGWRLLLTPCLMGLALARNGSTFTGSDALLVLVFTVGAIFARGAGCTFNDIIDRDIDRQVARTRNRPLPAGAISVRGAWLWLFTQILACFLVLLALPLRSALLSLWAIPLVAAYPFMKRITWWPQMWLGLCFSWGILVAAAAYSQPKLPALLLYAGSVCWVVAYDTLYALQDVEDDALVGVRSTARRFGSRWKPWTLLLYAAAGGAWMSAAWQAGASPQALIGLAIATTVCIGWITCLPSTLAPKQALSAFRANIWVGLAVTLSLASDPLQASIQSLR